MGTDSDTRLDCGGLGWLPIETCPQEDIFIGAVSVRDNRTGATWWERHLIALDDETGQIHADYDNGWELADYQWWYPLETPPLPLDPSLSNKNVGG